MSIADKRVTVEVNRDNNLEIDLSGGWDGGCCGTEASRLNEKLEELGISVHLENVFCRLSASERSLSVQKQECNTVFLRDVNVPEGRR